MLNSLLIKIITRLFYRASITIEQRIILTNAIMDKLAVIQSGDILTVDAQGTLTINGQTLDYEQSRALLESARAMKHSTARNLVRKQVEYLAVQHGIHKAQTPEQMLFSKAAVWWGQEEERLISVLAGEDLSL